MRSPSFTAKPANSAKRQCDKDTSECVDAAPWGLSNSSCAHGRTEGGLRQAREARSCGPTSSSTNKLVGWPHQHLTPTSHLTRQSLLGLKNIPPCAISYFLGVITPLESQVIMTTPASPTPCINKPVLSPFSSKLVVRGNVHGGCS